MGFELANTCVTGPSTCSFGWAWRHPLKKGY